MAVSDYFLKIEGIDGESVDSKHKGEIELLSWSWAETQAGGNVGSGPGSGRASLQDFIFTMKVNKASPKLMQACASGEVIKKAVLVCRKAGAKDQQEYLKITFTDSLVSSYQTGGTGGTDIIPTDKVTLDFAKIEIEYKEQKADGSLGGAVKGGWNIKENKVA